MKCPFVSGVRGPHVAVFFPSAGIQVTAGASSFVVVALRHVFPVSVASVSSLFSRACPPKNMPDVRSITLDVRSRTHVAPYGRSKQHECTKLDLFLCYTLN